MKQWKLKDLPNTEPTLSFPADLPPALTRTLRARGIADERQLRLFLQPPHRLPHSPLRLSGMDAALQRLHRALAVEDSPAGDKETVGIVGDFDVDGITGAAILVEGLAGFGVATVPYLPHRVTEGHGLSEEAVSFLAEAGATLLITVDCGVASVAEAAMARSRGIDVIITDHHVPPAEPPDVTAIINPGMPGDGYPCPYLCGAGLAFKLMQGLYERQGIPLPTSLLELAALGTIADLVPLTDENRFLVQQGLAELNRTRRPGLRAMFRLARLEEKAITAETVAFQIAPRLNSAGRMGHAADSLRLLTTPSDTEADILAQQLETQNRQRQELTREVSDAAQSWVAGLEELPPFIVITNPQITPGVAGLVAGRLAETFRRPAVALADVGDETFIASGRSIPAFNLIEAFTDCADLFLRFGGHAQAAGFSIKRENVADLERRLSALALDQLDGADLVPVLNIDAEVELSAWTDNFLGWLRELEPFGEGNPKPVFLTRNLAVERAWPIGRDGQHLKLLVNDGRRTMPALLFNRAAEWQAGGEGSYRVDLVYTASVDSWRGREQISLVVEDFRASG